MKKLLFVFCIVFSLSLFFVTVPFTSCNSPKNDTIKKEPCPEVAKGLLGTNFYELELSQNDYATQLKPFHGGDGKKLVFQFYLRTSWPNSPTLIAYSSKRKNDFKKAGSTRSAILSITTTQGIAVPETFVLGDQQIDFAEIDNLLSDAGNPANYTLLFRPKMDGINVCYEICVKFMQGGVEVIHCLGDAGTNTKPSPPADAN